MSLEEICPQVQPLMLKPTGRESTCFGQKGCEMKACTIKDINNHGGAIVARRKAELVFLAT